MHIKKQLKLSTIDKSFKSFIFLATFMTIILLLVFAFLIVPNIKLNDSIRYFIWLSLLFATALSILSLLIIIAFIIFVYNTKRVPIGLSFLSNVCLIYVFPILISLSDIIKKHNDSIRVFYIDFNNIIVKSNHKKYNPDDILILLPHCLQDSNCTFKITNDITNCRKCLKCNIGDIREIAEKYSVLSIVVVPGGTAARNIIIKDNPKLIIAVACKRDLASGLADVRKIPVIGILNKRPNGPCINTSLCMNEFEETLKSVLK